MKKSDVDLEDVDMDLLAELAMEDAHKSADWNNDVTYWDFQALDYDGEILSTITEDTSGNVKRILDTYKDKTSLATDFGCGVGKYLPSLCGRFKRVTALDFSEGLTKKAKLVMKNHKNLQVLAPTSLTETKKVQKLISDGFAKLGEAGGRESKEIEETEFLNPF